MMWRWRVFCGSTLLAEGERADDGLDADGVAQEARDDFVATHGWCPDWIEPVDGVWCVAEPLVTV